MLELFRLINSTFISWNVFLKIFLRLRCRNTHQSVPIARGADPRYGHALWFGSSNGISHINGELGSCYIHHDLLIHRTKKVIEDKGRKISIHREKNSSGREKKRGRILRKAQKIQRFSLGLIIIFCLFFFQHHHLEFRCKFWEIILLPNWSLLMSIFSDIWNTYLTF